MIVDYGPLPDATLLPIAQVLYGIFIVSLALTVFGFLMLEDRPPKVFMRFWACCAILTAILLPTVIIFGSLVGAEEDRIRDQHYPAIIQEAGYTDLRKIDNDEYAVESPEGGTVLVEVRPVEGFTTKFTVLETEN